MYSSFNPTYKHQFITQELKRKYLELPKEVSEAYSQICQSLLKSLPNFDNQLPTSLDPTNNEKENKYNSAREFTSLLPRHVMKIYQTLLNLENEVSNENASSVLDKPCLSIVDNGCGGGTATIAIISLLINYQKYRKENQLPLFPIAVKCLGLDTNYHVLGIYSEFITKCANNIKDLLIDIQKPEIIPHVLAQGIHVIEWLGNEKQISCVILAFSNIIRPLSLEHEKQKQIRENLKSASLVSGWGKHIGSDEVAVINRILNDCKVDKIILLLISASSKNNDGSRKYWSYEMSDFQKRLQELISTKHSIKTYPINQYSYKMINPNDSYWYKHKKTEQSSSISYHAGYTIIKNVNFTTDKEWLKVLEHNNLMLAWARVRNALYFDMLEDTLEIRLFEANIEERLSRLRHDLLSYNENILNVFEMLNFTVPKGEGKKPRPMSLCRLEDQILATAILQVKEGEYRKVNSPRSYAHVLSNEGTGEKLYEDWHKQYDKYLNDARTIAKRYINYNVFKTDLSSFYTDIIQSNLSENVNHELRIYKSRLGSLIQYLLTRNCGLDKKGYGIPQGHILSGALANIYLADLDKLFAIGNTWGIEYFRFVDDIIFIYPPTITQDFILGLLDKELDKLDLTRSVEKTTQSMSTQQFLKIYVKDDILEYLSKEHNFLLSDIYKLNSDYIQISDSNWWLFVELYQKVLMSVGVYISVPRLSRKLNKNRNWWRKYFNWWKKLKMPNIAQLEDLENTQKWQQEFMSYNSISPNSWIQKRITLIQKLTELVQSSLNGLESDSELIQSKSKTHLKFALYRLGQLGFGEVTHHVANLIVERPWTISVRRVCVDLALQGQENVLIDTFKRILNKNSEEWIYIRSIILKAFSHLPMATESCFSLLHDIVIGNYSILEKTMALESLFLLKHQRQLDGHLIDEIEKSEDGYLAKNLAIYLAFNQTTNNQKALVPSLNYKQILNESLWYIHITPQIEELYRYEPDIIREKFYNNNYPDDESEFQSLSY